MKSEMLVNNDADNNVVNKVLIFDIWTQGAKYTEALSRLMQSENINVKYVHIESRIRSGMPRHFRDLLSPPGTSRIGTQNCIDIDEYSGSYLKCLEEERPDVVVLLSTSHMANRVMIRACQIHGIKSVYIMHGEGASASRALELAESWKKASRWRFFFKLIKIPKYFYLFKQYFYVTGSISETAYLSIQCLTNPYKFIWIPEEHQSLMVDQACVFEEKDIEGVAQRLKIPREKMHVVGNLRYWDIRPEANEDLASLKPYVVYVDAAYVESGTITKEENTDFMEYLSEVAERHNYNLVVKLHPRSSMSTYYDLKKERDNVFVVDSDVNLHDVLKHSDLVIGHYSTALKEALGLGRNILCASWFDDIRGGKLFEDESEITCTKIKDFDVMFARFAKKEFDQQFIIDRYLPNIHDNALLNTLNVIREPSVNNSI